MNVIIFATWAHLQQLAASDISCVDRNFAIAPILFQQLYVIQGKVDNNYLPFIYMPLQYKTQICSKVMFRVLKQNSCDMTSVIIDFKMSVANALEAVFDPGVDIQYCFFHLTQSNWQKIQELGLTNLYKGNKQFHLFCGKLNSLAFLPVN